MNRTLLAVPFALVGCATTPSQLATDANLISVSVGIIAPVILASPGISPADAKAVTDARDGIQLAASVISGTIAGDKALSTGTLVRAVQALVPVAARYLPAGSQYSVAVKAAVDLLPVLMQAAGVMPTARMAAPAMPARDARAILGSVR